MRGLPAVAGGLGDWDGLSAGMALCHGLDLRTLNTAEFGRVPGLEATRPGTWPRQVRVGAAHTGWSGRFGPVDEVPQGFPRRLPRERCQRWVLAGR